MVKAGRTVRQGPLKPSQGREARSWKLELRRRRKSEAKGREPGAEVEDGMKVERTVTLCPTRPSLEQSEELLNGESAATDERAKRTDREFVMLGNREVDPHAGFYHHDMAADLPELAPSDPLKRFDRALARDVGEAGHQPLDCHDEGPAFRVAGQFSRGFLVFGPEPRGNRLFDVAQGLFFRLALGNATRQGRALDDEPPVFGFLDSDVEYHSEVSIGRRGRRVNEGRDQRP